MKQDTHGGSPLFGKAAHSRADAAGHHGLLDANSLENRVGSATDSGQVNGPAGIATPAQRVVACEAAKAVFVLLRMRLRLLKLRAQIGALALKRPDPLSKQGQVLAQHRSRAAFVDQRLYFLEQKVKHVVARGFRSEHVIGGHV
jgi:hypothetical protein